MNRPNFAHRLNFLAVSAAVLLLGGCAVTPVPLQTDELKSIVQQDQASTVKDMAPVSGAITLSEAIARALKYNLDHRAKLWEQALAVGQLDASRFDMLPKLMANLGYDTRDKTANTWRAVNDQPSSTPSDVSADKTHSTTDLGLSWNILDFGLSYYGAHQNADRVLIAQERRRKALHTLIQNVRTSFWRAASAEKLAGEVRDTIALAEKTFADSRKLSEARGKAPADALRYQRNLLESLRTLETLERELAAAKIELASLLNLPPGTDFKLAEPVGVLANPGAITLGISRMEEMALEQNPDLRENAYNARIAATETRKALLRLFPNLSFNYAGKHDNNAFLVNQGWNEAGARISWNMLSLLSGPSQMDAAETAVKVAEAKRMTVQMAVLTQVHLASRQYATAVKLFERSDAIWKVDNELLDFAKSGVAAQTKGEQEMISARTSSILSLVRRYQSLAQVHEAASKLEATLGLEPKISSLDDISLTDLTALIEKSLNQWPAKTAAAPEDSPEKSPMGFRLAFGNAVSPAPTFQLGTSPVSAHDENLKPLLASLGLSSKKVINGR
jgi:outer membrane protein TolC